MVQDFITLVVPVLNEEKCIAQALASLVVQLQGRPAEVLVMDGGSADGTCAIVERMAIDFPIIRLIDNPARLQSAACNQACALADPRCSILVRADAHAGYPAHFIEAVVTALRREHATSVVVPMRTVGAQALQRAIAATQNSVIGNGGSRHRRVAVSGFVDHGHHAAFDTAFFRTVGGYDPSFTHNEDAEFDVRAHQLGGRVWLCADAAIDYYPRQTLAKLARQYRQHGKGRARTTIKHKLSLKSRQLAPLLLLSSVVADIAAPLLPVVALPSCLYVGSCLGWGVVAAFRRRDPALLLMGPAAITMHLSWAAGFIEGQGYRVRARPARVSPAIVGHASLAKGLSR